VLSTPTLCLVIFLKIFVLVNRKGCGYFVFKVCGLFVHKLCLIGIQDIRRYLHGLSSLFFVGVVGLQVVINRN
jgi:hypothetical protein